MIKQARKAAEIERIGPPRRSANYLRESIRARGWALGDLAFWLGISRQYLYEIMGDVHRPRHWDLALENVPRLTKKEMRMVTEARRAAEQVAASSKPVPAVPALPGFRYHGALQVGSIVAASTWIGEMAEEGEEGVVIEIRSTAVSEEYLIRFAHGEEWFDPDAFDEVMVDTGQTSV
ncbi:hypothetical protein QU487_06645 [Crenobacter sp. SG2305]|uniref:hypothetical protein n=1 Tax=Crenobacter oryzisoli TaxID=3056844 RepID=UPI0025AB410E|nr:hypothetical protein [Crenobacter sp. SG2305]MDN0082432.1 hypothetical protein [Crenobacter sp. SG2305]